MKNEMWRTPKTERCACSHAKSRHRQEYGEKFKGPCRDCSCQRLDLVTPVSERSEFAIFETKKIAELALPYDLDRFLSWIETGSGCWTWTGVRLRRRDGAASYGTYGQPKILAHRLAWIFAFGPIPERQVVRHDCDNVACVRPDHLRLGTQADNLRDMRERGRARYNRFPTGTAHPNAKVDEEIVRAIREVRERGLSLAAIGRQYGLDPSTVHDIVRRRTWKAVA